MAMAAISKGGSHLRDASFSSYLDTADTDFVRSLAASMNGSSPVFTPSRQSSSPSPSPISKRSTRGPHGELNVFGAESYFSEKVDHHERTPSFRSVEDRFSETKPRNSSMRSESSYSSKSGSWLTRQTSRNTDQMKPKKSLAGPWFFAGLQCKGSCYDVKQPVYTNHLMIKQGSTINQRKGFWEDQVVQINSKKQPRHQIKAGETERILPSFAFPNFKDTREEGPRKSIGVFGSHSKTRKQEEEAVDMSAIERKLSMLSWDAIPIQSQDKRSNSGSCRYDDMDSDASSDLFDIAVFPAEMSPVTAPYEPSEASIEWSVVTASAAEFSAASDLDHEERQTATKKQTPFKAKPKADGGILGCRSDKAVKVVSPATSRKASYPPIPPKKTQIAGPKAATTTTITHFSPSPSLSARAPRAIYM